MKFFLSTITLVLTSGITSAQTPKPADNQFQVNTYTTGPQKNPAVAELPGQGFVVVWNSPSALDSYGVRGQVFDSDSTPIGLEFQVNAYTTYPQRRSSVIANSGGGFTVLWSFQNSTWGRHFFSNGLPEGGDFQINNDATGYASSTEPQVSRTGSGDYVVAWFDADTEQMLARLFDSDWNNIGPQFEVDAIDYDNFEPASLAPLNDGGFIIVWYHYPTVRGQKFNALGDHNGAEFVINTIDYGSGRTSIAAGDSGDLVVAWQSGKSSGNDTGSSSIQARLLNSFGTPTGSQFQVNSNTTGLQFKTSVISDGDGFLVVWESNHDEVRRIMGRRISSSRGFLGEEFLISAQRANHNGGKASLNGDNQYLIVWSSDLSIETDDDDKSVHAQAYLIPIFGDGFEGGNTDAWSSVSP